MRSVTPVDVLREVALFADLDDSEIALIARLSRLRPALPRNSIVFHEGDASDSPLVILEGRVKVSLDGPNGEEISLGTMGRASIVGEMALLDGAARSATVKTLEDTRLLEIVPATMLAAMERNPRLGATMMRHLARMLRGANEQIRTLSMSRAQIQVLRCLLGMAARGKGRHSDVVLEPRPTNQSLAERVGCRPETVSRAIKELRLAGHLSVTRDSIHIRQNVFDRFGSALADLL